MAEESRDGLEAARAEKLKRIAALGLDPWGQRFDDHQAIAKVRALEPPPAPEGEPQEPGPTVRIAGRIMLRRGQGRVVFLDVRDWTERIQVFIGKKQVGEQGWALVDELDLGDLIGVDGTLGFTKTGELTVFATALTFLGKSLTPPPEKWHGLTDLEARYRRRYVDLFSNPESLQTFLGRSKIVRAFRRVMEERGFVEVETPTMQSIAGGAAAGMRTVWIRGAGMEQRVADGGSDPERMSADGGAGAGRGGAAPDLIVDRLADLQEIFRIA